MNKVLQDSGIEMAQQCIRSTNLYIYIYDRHAVYSLRALNDVDRYISLNIHIYIIDFKHFVFNED